ncbi:MAG: acetolactate synthase 2 catalytic subunit [Kangiellaceae bacterium]|nr:acetolactate synthase 2 catalytic subunit [Kangiellaceae bacterium]
MLGANYLIKVLEEHKVDTVFGYPGGAIMPVYDALFDSSIKHILCRHEQGAVFAADGYARSSGKLGVCIATSGPGATNLLTGIANAYLDSVPLLAITGQVNSDLMGTDSFQEIDTLGLSFSIVKHSILVKTIDELPQAIYQAIHIAQEGRPGPVLLDITKDVQQAAIKRVTVSLPVSDCSDLDEKKLQQAKHLIETSSRPLFYAGGGIGMANASTSFRALANKLQIPIVTTLKGIGSVATNFSNNLGMLGMHGTKAANFAVQDCDLLIAVGARFDDRATGKLDEFAPSAKVIHFDFDKAEFDKLKFATVKVTGNLNKNLQYLEQQINCTGNQQWLSSCLANKRQYQFKYSKSEQTICASSLLNRLSKLLHDKPHIVTCDVGQHQMWVAQHMHFQGIENHLSSGGLGAMGYGLPAAIGAQLANKDHQVINVSGDGSIMMNIQELATLIRYQIPVKILLLDNQRLGMVRQWQQLFYNNRYSEVDLSDNPDFTLVANAFGIRSQSISSGMQVEKALQQFLDSEKSYLLHVSIDPKENVWPLVPPGKNNSQLIEGESL